MKLKLNMPMQDLAFLSINTTKHCWNYLQFKLVHTKITATDKIRNVNYYCLLSENEKTHWLQDLSLCIACPITLSAIKDDHCQKWTDPVEVCFINNFETIWRFKSLKKLKNLWADLQSLPSSKLVSYLKYFFLLNLQTTIDKKWRKIRFQWPQCQYHY